MNDTNANTDLIAILLQAKPPVVDYFLFFNSDPSKKKLVVREWIAYLN